VHHNTLNGLFLSDVIAAFRSKGWKWIDASEAFQDPVFKSEPDVLPAGERLMIALAKQTGNRHRRFTSAVQGLVNGQVVFETTIVGACSTVVRLDYQTKKADYVANILSGLDWDVLNRRFGFAWGIGVWLLTAFLQKIALVISSRVGGTSGPIWGTAFLRGAAAVKLFVARAQALDSHFSLDARRAAITGAVCRRLDGIPLAIELAAARVRSLTPDDLVARLDQRFRLLTRGSRAALERHQTLRNTIDWSYDLLGENEREGLNRLSVFAGGADLAALSRKHAQGPPALRSARERLALRLLFGRLELRSQSPTRGPSGDRTP
jgi:hypothetical protein